MRIFGRVAVCGVISEYSSGGRKASPNMLDIVYKRISIRGFLAADFLNVFEDFLSKTSDYLRTGKLKTIEDISSGVESIPSAFVGLFKGDNIGKKVISLAEEWQRNEVEVEQEIRENATHESPVRWILYLRIRLLSEKGFEF